MGEVVEKKWGSYEVLYEDEKCKVKKIVVNPGHRTSFQSHKHREETWKIISGGSHIVRGSSNHCPGCIFIAKEEKHRIGAPESNDEPLVLIEIQTGEYFGEDDIVRYEDDYGRVDNLGE